MYLRAESFHQVTTVLDGEVHSQQGPGEVDATTEASEGPIPDLMTWPLELAQTLVIYHPHAQRPPQVILMSKLSAFSRNLDPLESPDTDISDGSISSTRPPHFPFKTLANFEQTELFIKHSCTDPFINKQLGLWKKYVPNNGITLKNAQEMHQCLQAAGIEEDLSQVTWYPYVSYAGPDWLF